MDQSSDIKLNLFSNNTEIDVLYQKLGPRWYAFGEINGECVYFEVTEEEVKRAKETAKAA